MALKFKKVTLWRKETHNTPGEAAASYEPLAKAGMNLTVVMGYRVPGDDTKAILEIAPVVGKKSMAAAQSAGFAASSLPALLVEGDDRSGLGYAVTSALAAAGINVAFLVGQSLGRRVTAVLGFDSEEDLKKAGPIIRKAAAPAKKSSRKR